jgi:hypothetical protein
MATIAALLTSYVLAVALGVQSPPPAGTARMLFCAFGGVGMVPASPPPGYESEFAVAVVEINSPGEDREVAVSGFDVLDPAGKVTPMKRVMRVERFTRSGSAGDPASGLGWAAYYLNTDAAHPDGEWDGVLPAGDVRLRIRVALPRDPGAIGGRCRVRLGIYDIDGPSDAEWPT